MSSGSRQPSPPASASAPAPTHGPASALAPAHEAQTTTLTVSSPSSSPVPPTPPPKDMPFFRHQDDTTATATATATGTDTGTGTGTGTGSAMSKLGVKAAPPAMEDPTEVLVIDISRPVGEYDADPDSTLRVDEDEDGDGDRHGGGDRHGDGDSDGAGHSERTIGRDQTRIRQRGERQVPAFRDSDVTDMTDADITIVHPGRRSDSPEPGRSTLYGSAAALGGGDERERDRDRGHVQEHPLKLALHPPSPPPWDENGGEDGGGGRDRDRDLENGRRVLDEDLDEDDGDLGLGGRGGRASPQRYVLSGAKAQRVHDFSNKPRSHNRRLIPRSAYYFGPPPPDSAYGTDPCGQIGVHHPREIVRIERDYTGGELPQFTPTYPLELEGRITPTQFLETVNAINEILLSAHSLGHAFVDNALAFFSLQVTRAVKKTHYEKVRSLLSAGASRNAEAVLCVANPQEMERLHALIDELNVQIYNPMGLHIKWPHSVAFLFLEIEYY